MSGTYDGTDMQGSFLFHVTVNACFLPPNQVCNHIHTWKSAFAWEVSVRFAPHVIHEVFKMY